MRYLRRHGNQLMCYAVLCSIFLCFSSYVNSSAKLENTAESLLIGKMRPLHTYLKGNCCLISLDTIYNLLDWPCLSSVADCQIANKCTIENLCIHNTGWEVFIEELVTYGSIFGTHSHSCIQLMEWLSHSGTLVNENKWFN